MLADARKEIVRIPEKVRVLKDETERKRKLNSGEIEVKTIDLALIKGEIKNPALKSLADTLINSMKRSQAGQSEKNEAKLEIEYHREIIKLMALDMAKQREGL